MTLKLSNRTPSSSIVVAFGRHRAGRDAADIGVMAARGDPRTGFASSCHRTGVHTVMSAQMRAAIVGGVDDVDVPGFDPAVSVIKPRTPAVNRISGHKANREGTALVALAA